jgi:epoxyqueuosine reductase QueG
MTRVREKGFKNMNTEHLNNNPDAIKACEDAPKMGFQQKFDEGISPAEIFRSRRQMLTIKGIISIMRELRQTKKSLKNNSSHPKDVADEDFFKELEEYAESLEVKIGFTKLHQKHIFKDNAVLFDNVIILSMEMDKEKINQAPSVETGKMIMNTYNELGIRTNKLAEFIREKGFAAQASHPLGGAVSYPPLAFLAGMGWHGRHGLIITPEFGPRHRLSAILTNITNLPITGNNEYEWIAEYCTTCGRCIETCPGQAIYETPITHPDGRITHIDIEKCFPIFGKDHGCTVCVKECMFNRVGYIKLKELHNKKKKKVLIKIISNKIIQ